MVMTFEAPASLSGQDVALSVYDGEGPEDSKSDAAAEEEAAEATEDSVATDPAAEAIDPITEDSAAETIEQVNSDLQEAAEEQADDTFWEEIALLGELSEAERKCQELESKLFDLTEDRKDTKKCFEAAVLEVRMLAGKIADLAKDKKLPTKPKAESTELEGKSTELEVSQVDDDSWRDTDTRELLAGLKGMGAKKMDALADLAPTAGKLEDLRSEASLSYKPFKDVLPQGFGEKVASAIEERLLDHVTKGSAPRCADQVEPRVEKVDESDAVADEPIPVITEDMKAVNKLAIVNAFDALRKQVEEENGFELLALADCEVDENSPVNLMEGFSAYENNEPVHACDECTFQGQLDWVFGWCLARAKERLLAAGSEA